MVRTVIIPPQKMPQNNKDFQKDVLGLEIEARVMESHGNAKILRFMRIERPKS